MANKETIQRIIMPYVLLCPKRNIICMLLYCKASSYNYVSTSALKIPVPYQPFHSRYYINSLICTSRPVNCILKSSSLALVNKSCIKMTSVTVCYSNILKVHSMNPITRTKLHALLTIVIFMHQVSSKSCTRSVCIIFQQIQLQSLETYARHRSRKTKSGQIRRLRDV